MIPISKVSSHVVKLAEEMAEGLLNRESPPLTTEVLQMLNSWKFKSNPYRNNVMPYNWEFVYSECFGMTTTRNQTHTISTNSRNKGSIDQVIIKWLWSQYPKEMEGHTFTSMTINSDFAAQKITEIAIMMVSH